MYTDTADASSVNMRRRFTKSIHFPLVYSIEQFLSFHYFQNVCRSVICPLGQYKLKGKCRPIFKETPKIEYQVNLDLNIALTSHFHPELEVCSLSLWTKPAPGYNTATGKYPMIIFNLVLNARKWLGPYTSFLKMFDFLHNHERVYESWKWKFYFADHVYFDEENDKAIDLSDNFELIKQVNQYTFDSVHCHPTIHITEMHFCERVKLHKEEYVIYNKDLYLKKASKSLYENQFFTDQSNQTFVCIEKFNKKVKQTSNTNPDDVDTRRVIQQAENKEPTITKDFAFFIGCLALVTLFVTMALAKRKYLQKKSASVPPNDNTRR